MKKVQLIDLVNLMLFASFCLIVGSFSLAIFGLCTVNVFMFTFNLVLGILFVVGVLFPLSVLIYNNVRYQKRNTYGFMNPITNVVEFHIGKKVKTQIQFARAIFQMKSFSEDINKDMVFCTNLVSAEKVKMLEKKMNVRIDVYKTGFVEKVSFYVPYFFTLIWTRKFDRHPLVKGIVRIAN